MRSFLPLLGCVVSLASLASLGCGSSSDGGSGAQPSAGGSTAGGGIGGSSGGTGGAAGSTQAHGGFAHAGSGGLAGAMGGSAGTSAASGSGGASVGGASNGGAGKGGTSSGGTGDGGGGAGGGGAGGGGDGQPDGASAIYAGPPLKKILGITEDGHVVVSLADTSIATISLADHSFQKLAGTTGRYPIFCGSSLILAKSGLAPMFWTQASGLWSDPTATPQITSVCSRDGIWTVIIRKQSSSSTTADIVLAKLDHTGETTIATNATTSGQPVFVGHHMAMIFAASGQFSPALYTFADGDAAPKSLDAKPSQVWNTSESTGSLLFSRVDGSLKIANLDAQTVTSVGTASGALSRAMFVPAGVTWSDDAGHFMQPDSGTKLKLQDPPMAFWESYSPDNAWMLWSSETGGPNLLSSQTIKIAPRPTLGGAVGFTADSSWVAMIDVKSFTFGPPTNPTAMSLPWSLGSVAPISATEMLLGRYDSDDESTIALLAFNPSTMATTVLGTKTTDSVMSAGHDKLVYAAASGNGEQTLFVTQIP